MGLAGKTVKRLVGRISDNEVISGIVGWRPDPLRRAQLTEEFVSVYRMHPLIPDDYTFRAVASDEVLQEQEFAQVAQRSAMELMNQVAMQDLFYSFGRAHPAKSRCTTTRAASTTSRGLMVYLRTSQRPMCSAAESSACPGTTSFVDCSTSNL